MIDKDLFRFLGSNKKYVFLTVAVMAVGLFANVSITACICWAISLAINEAEAKMFILPAVFAAILIAVRYACTRISGDLKDTLGRKVKKDLRKQVYDKIVRLGVRSTDGMSMAGLTQVAMEGVEQLDLYYSSYIPQFFYSMLAPFILFFICFRVFLQKHVAQCLALRKFHVCKHKYNHNLSGHSSCFY